MSIKAYVASLIRRLTRSIQSRHPESQPVNGDELLIKLLHMIDRTEEVELSCDEVLRYIDQYADLAVSNKDAAYVYPLVKKHLDRCLECEEEYEALVRILESLAKDIDYAQV